MTTFNKIYAIITAGGVSSRFGSNKLLETLSDKKSVICTTVKKFLPFCNEVIIPCHSDVKEHIEAAMPAFLDKIKFVRFGKTRQESVFNGLLECEKLIAAQSNSKNNSFKNNIVLIHDGARPFIKSETIQETIEKLKEHKGVCVGIYATDTIKITDKEGKIIKTVDRDTVFCAQTPQGFHFDTILNAHKKLKGESFTDDSGMLEHLGIEVYALIGTQTNKKITFKEDLI